MATKLECPNCGDCLDIKYWNGYNNGAVAPIPEDLTIEGWGEYKRIHGTRLDCPSCDEVCIVEDMDAY